MRSNLGNILHCSSLCRVWGPPKKKFPFWGPVLRKMLLLGTLLKKSKDFWCPSLKNTGFWRKTSNIFGPPKKKSCYIVNYVHFLPYSGF